MTAGTLLEIMREDGLRIFVDTAYRAPDTLRTFQKRVGVCLRALGETHPDFKDVAVMLGEQERALPQNSSGLDELIAKAVFDAERPDDYLATAADGSLLPDSQHRFGFTLTLVGRESSFRIRFSGNSSGNAGGSRTVFEFPLSSGCEWNSAARMRAILEVMVEHWEADYARVLRLGFQRRLWSEFGKQDSTDWMTYFSRKSLIACMPTDIRREPLGRGELLITTEHMPDPANESDLDAARRVRAALADFGLADEPLFWAVHGWPPDEEERRYEQAISGAPPDLKYVVNCVDFDGYDSQRKVLLYAKLFRQLRVTPKAWGLRGMDAPVLNEAHRQVRAAAKAGGVPIEWHIGLEEPARRAAELLAEYGGIPENRIQVFHTPFEAIQP